MCVCQFLKGAESGEVAALGRFEDAILLRAEDETGKFLWQMDAGERAACLARQRELLERVSAADADVYVLDEAIDAMQAGAFSAETLLERVKALRGRGEVALTGHEAPEALLSGADYITRMQKLRHPYDHGHPRPARHRVLTEGKDMIRFLAKILMDDPDKYDEPGVRRVYGMLCGAVGIGLNILLFAAKYLAGLLSHSIAITADAFNNSRTRGRRSSRCWASKSPGARPTANIRLDTDRRSTWPG